MNILIASVWSSLMILLLLISCKVLGITHKCLKRVIKDIMGNYYLKKERLKALELFARDLKELEMKRLQDKEVSLE